MGGEHLHCCYREQVAYSLYSKFCEPKLFRLAVSGRWEKIPARCKSHPKEASFVHKYPPSDTALHRIVRPNPGACSVLDESDDATIQKIEAIKLEAVDALLGSNRQVACMQDSFGRTPLHLACMQSCLEEVALCILSANPRAAAIKDLEQRTPLHCLLARNDIIPLSLLQKLVEVCPTAVHLQDATGDTAADIVEERRQEIVNAEEVLAILSKVLNPP
jgi:hypothetical protein